MTHSGLEFKLDTSHDLAVPEAQWIFCNNHDNWRLQTLTGRQQLYVCRGSESASCLAVALHKGTQVALMTRSRRQFAGFPARFS